VQPPGDASDELVVSTPERVAFAYDIAGIGSRLVAQLIDGLIIGAIFIVIGIFASALGGVFGSPEVAGLVFIILTFILIAGYFLISEAAANGQTIGKRAVRLRVVGDQGQPIGIGQAAIRNLVRIVDFLPVFYGIGIIAMFSNARSKRLGDFAAGTLVVRDRQRVSLYDLPSTPADTPAPAAPVASIWAQPAESATQPPVEAPVSQPSIGPLDPALRRLVVAYAARREELPPARRQALAQNAEAALRRVLPEVVTTAGPLAALDQLAEREGVSPYRPMHKGASSTMTWGIVTLVFFWFPLVAVPTGIMSVIFGRNALRAIRREPNRYQGEDRASTGRLLGIIGLAVSSIILILIILGLIFRSG
jgi:uncharacterized RDD family membrane protein YckC